MCDEIPSKFDYIKEVQPQEYEKIYTDLKDNFPSFIPDYWLKQAACNHIFYINYLKFHDDFYKEQKKLLEDYLKKVRNVIQEVEWLDKESMYDFSEILNRLNPIQEIYEGHLKQLGLAYKSEGKAELGNRAKQTYREESFLLGLFLDLWYHYKIEKQKFIKEDFYRFAGEVMVHLKYKDKNLNNICFEEESSNSQTGKIQTKFYWQNGEKIFQSSQVQRKIEFKCNNFDPHHRRCLLQYSRKNFKQLCGKTDKSRSEDYYNSYLKSKMGRILKQINKHPEYYHLSFDNHQLLNLYNSDSTEN